MEGTLALLHEELSTGRPARQTRPDPQALAELTGGQTIHAGV